MARTSRRKKTSRRPRRTSRKARRRVAAKGLVVYKTKRGRKWKIGKIPAGLNLRSWRKSHKGARVLGHAVSYKAQRRLLKRLLKKTARVRRRVRRSRR